MARVGSTTAWDSSTNSNLNTYRASGIPQVGDNGAVLAVTTTNIQVYSNGAQVGFVQSASPSESRDIIKVQELGTEGVVQSVPGNTRGGQLAVARFAVYNSTLFNALGLTKTGKFVQVNDVDTSGSTDYSNDNYRTFGNPFKTLKDQRVPLEFKVRTRMPSGNEKWFEEIYLDCWLSSYSKTIASSTVTITEQATIQYSEVITNVVES